VVSIDGDQASHDARRGPGTYGRTVANLHALLVANPSAQVALAAVLTAAQIDGEEGDAVRSLADELGVRARFKPILPIGRATRLRLAPEFYSSLEDGEDCGEIFTYRGWVAATCGLGMNLYIGPDGECYPCYALLGARHRLDNALNSGLTEILASKRYQALKRVTVDSNHQCRHCTLRYLCGGFCRVWGSGDDPDAPPADCTALHERARGLLFYALEALGKGCVEQWVAAGLPLPEAPPKLK
jgi:uncharacterized protein